MGADHWLRVTLRWAVCLMVPTDGGFPFQCPAMSRAATSALSAEAAIWLLLSNTAFTDCAIPEHRHRRRYRAGGLHRPDRLSPW